MAKIIIKEEGMWNKDWIIVSQEMMIIPDKKTIYEVDLFEELKQRGLLTIRR